MRIEGWTEKRGERGSKAEDWTMDGDDGCFRDYRRKGDCRSFMLLILLPKSE